MYKGVGKEIQSFLAYSGHSDKLLYYPPLLDFTLILVYKLFVAFPKGHTKKGDAWFRNHWFLTLRSSWEKGSARLP